MALKYNNNSVSKVTFNGSKVVEIKKDGTITWELPGTYTTGTLPTGVASLTCTRNSKSEPTGSTGTLVNNGTTFNKDKLYWTATASAGYDSPTVTYGSTSSLYTVTATPSNYTSDVNGVVASGLQPGSLTDYTCYASTPSTGTVLTLTITKNGQPFLSLSGSDQHTSGTIHRGDILVCSCTVATGYKPISPTTVNVTGDYSYSPIPEKQTYTMHINFIGSPSSYSPVIDTCQYRIGTSGSWLNPTISDDFASISGLHYGDIIQYYVRSTYGKSEYGTTSHYATHTIGAGAGDNEVYVTDHEAYTYTKPTITGISSYSIYVKSAYAGDTSYSLYTGTQVHYGDSVYWTATASSGYDITNDHPSSNPLTVTGAVDASTYLHAALSNITISVTKSSTNILAVYYQIGSGAKQTWTSGNITASGGSTVKIWATSKSRTYMPNYYEGNEYTTSTSGSVSLTTSTPTSKIYYHYRITNLSGYYCYAYCPWTGATTTVATGAGGTGTTYQKTVYNNEKVYWGNFSPATGYTAQCSHTSKASGLTVSAAVDSRDYIKMVQAAD